MSDEDVDGNGGGGGDDDDDDGGSAGQDVAVNAKAKDSNENRNDNNNTNNKGDDALSSNSKNRRIKIGGRSYQKQPSNNSDSSSKDSNMIVLRNDIARGGSSRGSNGNDNNNNNNTNNNNNNNNNRNQLDVESQSSTGTKPILKKNKKETKKNEMEMYAMPIRMISQTDQPPPVINLDNSSAHHLHSRATSRGDDDDELAKSRETGQYTHRYSLQGLKGQLEVEPAEVSCEMKVVFHSSFF